MFEKHRNIRRVCGEKNYLRTECTNSSTTRTCTHTHTYTYTSQLLKVSRCYRYTSSSNLEKEWNVLRLLWYTDNMNIILCQQLYLQDLQITHLVKNDTIVPIAICFRPILSLSPFLVKSIPSIYLVTVVISRPFYTFRNFKILKPVHNSWLEGIQRFMRICGQKFSQIQRMQKIKNLNTSSFLDLRIREVDL